MRNFSMMLVLIFSMPAFSGVERQNHYQILGVERSASAEEIHRAYQKLAIRYHPDSAGHSNNITKFKEVSEAHQILSDPQTRRQYDRTLPGEKVKNHSSERPSRQEATSGRPASSHSPRSCATVFYTFTILGREMTIEAPEGQSFEEAFRQQVRVDIRFDFK